MGNQLLYKSLVLSLTIHLFFLIYFNFHKLKIFNKQFKQVEVTYKDVKIKTVPESEIIKQESKITRQEDTVKKVDVLSKKSDPFLSMEKDIKDISKLSDRFRFEKKQIPKIKTTDGERKITIPLLKSEKITNPKYLSYNEFIREKIKQRAYSFVNNPDFEAGEVYLTFVLGANGSLRDLKIIDEKTEANENLRTIGLRSIRESNPFPPFPKDLTYPELTFNVIISFEVKN